MALIAFLKFFTNFKSDFRSLLYPFFESKIDFSMVFSNDFVLRKIPLMFFQDVRLYL